MSASTLRDTLWRWLPSSVLATYPFLAGTIHAPIVRPLEQYLARACIFFSLFLCWALLRQQVQMLRPNDESKQRRNLRKLAALLLALCTLFGLQLFLLRFGDLLFYLCLFALGASALSSAMRLRDRLFFAALAQLASVATICALSFALDTPLLTWQALVFGVGVGAASALVPLSQELLQKSLTSSSTLPSSPSSNGSAPKAAFAKKRAKTLTKVAALKPQHTELEILRSLKQRTTLLRSYALCLLLAPTAIASLCYLGQLPKLYVLAFALVPYAMPLLQQVRGAEQGAALPSSFIAASTRIAALFLLILALIGIVVRSVGG
jgi:hypothetical protein